jgi:hypothetical protein
LASQINKGSKNYHFISLIHTNETFIVCFFWKQNSNENKSQSLPVLMPGDHIPKFIALPCPREPPRQEKIFVTVQKSPPKPPRIAVPLY